MDGPTPYHEWLAALCLQAGYDMSSGRGGRSALAEAIGADPSVIGKIFGGNMPALETQRKIAKELSRRGVSITPVEMFVRSGTLRPEDLPKAADPPPPPVAELNLEAIARQYGIAEERVQLFVRSVESVAKSFADDRKGSSIGKPHAGGTVAEG